MSSSSTSQEQDHYHYAPPSAPPPTPSSHSHLISSSAPAIENLSQLFNRLPPNLSLSLPKRRPSHISPISPVISLPDLSLSFSRAFELGFFQLTDHNISSQLVKLAETDSLSLFHLSREKKYHHFPQNWPLGYEDDIEEDVKTSESFCFDSSCYDELAELKLESLREFTQEMEKVGLEIIEAMSCAIGFDNPTREDPTRICSLMWVSEETPGNNKQVMSGKMYPYVVGLQYQLRGEKSMMLADSGWVSVPTRVESVLVTLGDIAQVYSHTIIPALYNFDLR